jgi:hypothetical protein
MRRHHQTIATGNVDSSASNNRLRAAGNIIGNHLPLGKATGNVEKPGLHQQQPLLGAIGE